jgi:osmoprotectant transport system permease protein
VIAGLVPLIPLADGFVRKPGQGTSSCVADNSSICISWAIDNFDRYWTAMLEHIELVVMSVVFGFVIALGMTLISARRHWLVPAFTGVSGVIYTIPSIGLFLLLLPITGRGTDTAVIALTLYTLQILYRNNMTGLANVPAAAKDAGRGMGMSDRQLLWRVELPLALPEIIAGLRIATVSTVAIATLAVFAGAGGLGAEIYNDITFKTGIVVAGGLAVLLAIGLDVLLVVTQRFLSPWRKVRPV